MNKIKKAVTIGEKIDLVESIASFSVSDLMVNSTFKEIAVVCYIAKSYADYEFKLDEYEQVDLILTYDMLISSGIYYDEILPNINKLELESVRRMVDDEISSRTSLVNIILNKMNSLNSEDIAEKLNSFDLSKFTQIQSVIKTLQGSDKVVGDR